MACSACYLSERMIRTPIVRRLRHLYATRRNTMRLDIVFQALYSERAFDDPIDLPAPPLIMVASIRPPGATFPSMQLSGRFLILRDASFDGSHALRVYDLYSGRS